MNILKGILRDKIGKQLLLPFAKKYGAGLTPTSN